MSKETGKRYVWVDVLNILAIVSVLLLHTNTAINAYDGNFTRDFYWTFFVHSAFIWPVNVFYMLCGCNLIGRVHKNGIKTYISKRVSKTVIPFLFWSLVYYLLKSRSHDYTECVNLLLNGKFIVYMWFFIPLFAIYLSLPWLEKMVLACTKEELRKFLILTFVACICIPFINSVTDFNLPQYLFPMGLGYLFMPVLGYYLNEYNLSFRYRIILYCASVTAILLIMLGLIIRSNEAGVYDNTYMQYQTPLCVILSMGVFVLFKNAKVKWGRLSENPY